jgi:hypothetical protein
MLAERITRAPASFEEGPKCSHRENYRNSLVVMFFDLRRVPRESTEPINHFE